MKPHNFVAKHMRQFNRASIMLSDKRKHETNRVAWINQENALGTCFMQEEWHNELIDELDAREEE